jgi:hypothetical protein
MTAADAPREAPGNDERDLRGRVELLEFWFRDRVVTIANRGVVLRSEPTPLIPGELPFVVATTLPQPFMFGGKSEVELLADLQAMLWDLQNQRIDNVRLINNAVVFYREGAQGDESQMQFFPGARIPVQSPQDMVPWSPNTSILQPAIEAENRIMSDMERISGAVSAISGANPESINGATATQYQGVVSMAAKRLMRKKQQVLYALRRVGLQQIKLNQALLSQPERIRLQAESGGGWDVVTPQQIQGDLEFEVEDVAESLLQEQRRAQALALAQFYIGNLPAFQAGGLLPNMGALGQMVDKAFDQEPGKFLQAAPMPMMPDPVMGGAAPPVTPGGGGGGTPSQMLEQGIA